ncbi:hypothetical protein BJX96DRAFT_179410 [Aspergillus floccosus]
MAGSPSYSSDLRSIPRKGARGLSDVQAKVAFLNNLSRTGSPAGNAPPPPPQTSSSSNAGSSAALQRAILGREEAESALAHVNAQLEEAQSRERRISERLESLLEELASVKERQGHERNVFEKEIRKARKEAFRAGSTLVKLQEDLKNAKNEAKGLKDELRAEKEAKEQAKQEAFERAYALAGLMEEMEVLKEQLRAAQTNNRSDNLEAEAQAMQTKDAGRLSLAEGDLALLATPRPPKRPAEEPTNSPLENVANADTPKATPPKKVRLSEMTMEEIWEREIEDERQRAMMEAEDPQEKIAELREYLRHERSVREEIEETVEYMRWECSIGWCQCRIDEYRAKQAARRKVLGPPPEELRSAEERARNPPKAAEIIKENEAMHWSRWSKMKPEDAVKIMDMQAKIEADILAQSENKQNDEQEAGDQKSNVAELDEKNAQHIGSSGAVEDNMKRMRPITGNHQEARALPEPVEDTEEKHELEDEVEVTEEVEEVEDDDDDQEEEPLITFSPATGTFHTIPSPARSPKKHIQNDSPIPERHNTISPMLVEHQMSPEPALNDVPFQPCDPQPNHSPAAVDVPWDYPLPKHSSAQPSLEIREFKVPLRNDAPIQRRPPVISETPINREEALAQIRARRGRTNTMKRSVSANESTFRSGGMGITPVRVARRIPGVQNAEKSQSEVRSRRDLSAPVRMFHR